MAKGQLDTRFKLSHDRCLSSAMTLLDYQVALEPSWYKSSLTRQVLTLAAMILFLELELARRFNNTDTSSRVNVLQVLERSCDLWRRAKDFYEEAGRVYDILVRMIASFRPESATTSAHALDLQGFSSPFTAFDGVDKSLEKETLDVDIDWVRTSCYLTCPILTSTDYVGCLHPGYRVAGRAYLLIKGGYVPRSQNLIIVYSFTISEHFIMN